MARKGWTSLSAGYRERLERNGISRSDYEAGVSLKAARSHAHTPEHPRQYNPTDYPSYHSKRENLIDQLETRKERLWGDRTRWDDQKAKGNVRKYPPTVAQLKWAANADDEDLLDAIGSIDDNPEYAFLGYH